MTLHILLPTRILLEQDVSKVTTEAENGGFCVLPKHVDFVAALVPGILMFETADGEEYVAIDEGVFVKQGGKVLVSVRQAVRGKQLGELQQAVAQQFQQIDEQERAARSVIAKFEADFARRFLELEG